MSVQHYDQSDDSGPWQTVDEYVYRDQSGHACHRVVKQVNGEADPNTSKPKKRFIQYHDPGGEPLNVGTTLEQPDWQPGKPEKFVLWEAQAVAEAKDIIHVEGEGVAIFVNEHLKKAKLYGNIVATTSPGGAKNWQPYLAEAYHSKNVYAYPDWDQDGYDYATAVMASAKASGAMVVKVIELDNQEPTNDAKDWLSRDGNTIEKLIKLARFSTAWTPEWRPLLWKAEDKSIPTWKHGDAPPKTTPWLIRNRLPETGVVLLAGQWGTYKTFMWLDISGAVMTGLSWTGEPVYRRGGVLVFAPEGFASIPMRLAAMIENAIEPRIDEQTLFTEKPDLKRMPFERAEECPVLYQDQDALERMVATAKATDAGFREHHGVPLCLIVVDTATAAAGWENEDRSAETSKVWNLLRELSNQTGALVLIVDHFGKNAEAGTRGSSAKEANSDAVLALLGERQLSGEVRNTRLALRKLRDGPQGQTFAFGPRTIDMGHDEHGYALTQLVIDWSVKQEKETRRRTSTEGDAILMEEVAKMLNGPCQIENVDGRQVKVIAAALLRKAFMKRFKPDEDVTSNAKKKAWSAALKKSGLVGEEIKGVQYLWWDDADGTL